MEEKNENFNDRLKRFNGLTAEEALKEMGSNRIGLSSAEAKRRIFRYGANDIADKRKSGPVLSFLKKFLNPLIIILMIVSILSFSLGEKLSATIVMAMAIMSTVLSFVQEYRADRNAEKLNEMVKVSIKVLRDGELKEISLREIVPGDCLELTAGKMVPADLKIITSKDLHINQSSLNGESFPVEKDAKEKDGDTETIYDLDTIILMGTSVVSGNALALAINTGKNTIFGQISDKLTDTEPETAFDIGIKKFSWLMIKIIIVLSIFIFAVNIFFKSEFNLIDSLLFSLAIGIGLTPDMLPMIIAINLSRGAMRLSKKKLIVKRLDAIQNIGAMDILCTDKTGTLTLDEVSLMRHCDIAGNENEKVFELAYINSTFQTGLENLLDRAVIKHGNIDLRKFKKIDEMPFDFQRRIVSVVVDTAEGRMIYAKGAPEEIIKRCGSYKKDNQLKKIDAATIAAAKDEYDKLSREGFRVLAIAEKMADRNQNTFGKEDEKDLCLTGFIAFLDPPKPSANRAIESLNNLGVNLKILSGDNELVVEKICQEVGMAIMNPLKGDDIDSLSDSQLAAAVEETNIFSRLSPMQKERVIKAIRKNGHIVGYLGDGINDAPALKAADTGISVDNATDIAKETADIILLERDLTVLCDSVREGRRTFANTLKYLKMGASSNFGNMLSLTGASLFLPFLPLLPSQLLLNNYLYDVSQIAIPTDNVDEEYLARPKPWNIDFIKEFIFVFGPVSSIFDFAMYYVMYKVFNASPELFRSGWFLESLATQVFVVYIIRTAKVPFLESRPSRTMFLSTLSIVLIGVAFVFTPFATMIGFVIPPLKFFLVIIVFIIAYLILTEIVKRYFIRKFGYN